MVIQTMARELSSEIVVILSRMNAKITKSMKVLPEEESVTAKIPTFATMDHNQILWLLNFSEFLSFC